MALAEAVERGNHDDIGHLIGMLDSSDPALRMFAERALERLTGQTLEYRFSDPEPERAEAVARWVAWYEGEGPSS